MGASRTRCRRLSGMANIIRGIGISGFLETTACMMKPLLAGKTRCRRLSGMAKTIQRIGISGFLETTACMMKTRLASKPRCRRLSGMANTIQRIGISGFLETKACMMKTLLTSSSCAGRIRSSPEPELFERSTPLALLIANSREFAIERQLEHTASCLVYRPRELDGKPCLKYIDGKPCLKCTDCDTLEAEIRYVRA